MTIHYFNEKINNHIINKWRANENKTLNERMKNQLEWLKNE